MAMGIIVVALAGYWALTVYHQRKAEASVSPTTERVIIIGASTGIGRHLSLLYASRGAHLILVSRRLPLLTALATECLAHALCKTAHVVQADITVESDIAAIARAASEVLGGADTVVINAGVLSVLPFRDVCRLDDAAEGMGEGEGGQQTKSAKVVTQMFQTNVFGPVLVAKHFTDMLIASGGKFVVVSSLAGVLAAPTRSLYTSTKFAITGFFTALRIELAKHNVSVCLVFPGSVDTDLRSSALDAKPLPSSSSSSSSSNPPPPSETSSPSTSNSTLKSKMSPRDCAEGILRAADRKARETYLPRTAWAGVLVRQVVPEIVDWLAARKYGFA
ncbi:hypothetical protein HK104_002598 [Borealophlyctis nickersoniae]|nr:hypothetical protein HK104_002598 [Borealophlyctis nickersoniae]